jgi:hypothetical protein
MALTAQPRPANLSEVYIALHNDPATSTYIASGSVTEPQNYVVPRCQINAVPSGVVPPAAASRLGVKSSQQKFRVSLMPGIRANPGMNMAVYLTSGIYETNFTFDDQGYAADENPAFRNPANYLSRWENQKQKRVYFVMPSELTPSNEGAEREHCNDFILAYQLTLHAVDAAFQSLIRVTMDGFLSMKEATDAMIKRVGETLAPPLRPIACDPVKLDEKFKNVLQKSRDGRDGKGWHSFGLEVIDQPPQNLGNAIYLTGKQRQESGRVYLKFTRGQTQINMHPSQEVITL